MSLQVFWPQREYQSQRERTKTDIVAEVQLLFTSVPSEIGWYSLAYNASATGNADGMNINDILTYMPLQLVLLLVEACLQSSEEPNTNSFSMCGFKQYSSR